MSDAILYIYIYFPNLNIHCWGLSFSFLSSRQTLELMPCINCVLSWWSSCTACNVRQHYECQGRIEQNKWHARSLLHLISERSYTHLSMHCVREINARELSVQCFYPAKWLCSGFCGLESAWEMLSSVFLQCRTMLTTIDVHLFQLSNIWRICWVGNLFYC